MTRFGRNAVAFHRGLFALLIASVLVVSTAPCAAAFAMAPATASAQDHSDGCAHGAAVPSCAATCPMAQLLLPAAVGPWLPACLPAAGIERVRLIPQGLSLDHEPPPPR